jgi:phosphoribosylaminoimidazolecarboxamide formyltransferase/IMP cyclohydrolase
MPRALFTVSDKTNLSAFAQSLVSLGWEIVATGGTLKALEADRVPCIPSERLTNLPEMLGGRVKTLHPAIHAALLARDTEADRQELARFGYQPLDLVVCNLYPFQEALRRPDLSEELALENIDIGGVTLLRAAAKNYERVTVVVDPTDYPIVLDEIQARGATRLETRRRLAIQAFKHTTSYDHVIYSYLAGEQPSSGLEALAPELELRLYRLQSLRYGENPHQQAAFYSENPQALPLNASILGGKELSYNNILDAEAAWRTATSFDRNQAAVVIVKHLTPCGVAVGASLEEAYPLALASDPVSAFGGVIAVNQKVTRPFVESLGDLFIEVLVAPAYTPEALALLAQGRKNCRLLAVDISKKAPRLEARSVLGGWLLQERDLGDPLTITWQVVTKRAPTPVEKEALRFAWMVVGHVKSNAIVLAQASATVGVGGGLPSRVDAVKLALEKAGSRAQGAAMASDAFFPFPDGVEIAAQHGVSAVIQPGGSIRDAQVIEAADKAGLAMVFTQMRHFRH